MRPTLTPFVFVSVPLLFLFGCGGSGPGGPPAPTPTPSSLRSYKVTVAGTRGSLAARLNGALNTVLKEEPFSIATPITGTGLLVAPPSYGDRNFVGWQHNGATFTTNPSVNTLPEGLNNGDTLTALYAVAGVRTGALAPNYNQPDSSVWLTANQPLKIFFDPTLSADEQALMNQGIARWLKALGNKITLTPAPSEAAAQIVLKTGTVTGAFAQTLTTMTSNTPPKPLVKATITFDRSQLPLLNTPLNRDVFIALVAHEFGHAMGINSNGTQGHSTDSADIMSGVVGIDNRVISARDINTMMNIYATLFDGRHVPISRAIDMGERFHQTVTCTVRLR